MESSAKTPAKVDKMFFDLTRDVQAKKMSENKYKNGTKSSKNKKSTKKRYCFRECHDGGWNPLSLRTLGRSLREDCSQLGVLPAHPNLIHADFFQWGKILGRQQK